MLQKLSLSLTPGAHVRHVRAGAVLRVIEPHEVRANMTDLTEVRDLQGGGAGPALGSAVFAAVGDLVVELVDVASGQMVAHSYLAGTASTVVRTATPGDAEVALFEPARVVRLSKVEQVVDELNAMGSSHIVDEVEVLMQRAIAEMQRARWGDADVALVDVEGGDAYLKIAAVLGQWWNDYEPEGPPAPESLTCHLIGASVRNRKIAKLRRRNPGIAYLHHQPPRHAGWAPAGPFTIQALVEATLAS